ncbi:hypothetical protein J056_004376 [Wallemia ichthyophaga EXF-994]|uniref:Small ribosomal subunit protein mS38 n=1 Tax=Wallemia ichthyophaga (strain EXF-994 / CBS 113033) TaxID=1299270 RepID=R9AG00_WALI9|nr:uncharacterized protein J056_004376 [Wallemia ichthyophaga EXF-994]TIA97409.1 hypothetical protein E3P95_02871 [Wallemia ichthyophaga]EOR01055.1 hypothetical protein J056_004376 [Wallemia ichthyophaga EXF-994]TIA99839.1 hypothetical protein E3P94_02396 [Wallemia ichthyophaga]TIB30684.1 hypothetical protein E3P84_03222 [Wallemia ichthyophaga]TIB39983.1 hypothetical protein E3P83_03165 [Wallemia ichthyophaga]
MLSGRYTSRLRRVLRVPTHAAQFSSINAFDRTLQVKEQPEDREVMALENKQNLAFETFVAAHRPLFISGPALPSSATPAPHKLNDDQIDSILDDIDCALFKVKITELADYRGALARIGLGESLQIELDSVKRKRKKKMNKHKYRKRRKAHRAERKRLGK